MVSGRLEEAAEAADEAMARAFERWERVRTLDSPHAWTYRVGVNILRRRGYRRQLEQSILRRYRPEVELPAPAGEAWLMLRELTERQRAVLVLRFVGDLREREIAAALGISRSTVSSTLAEALKRLRAQSQDISEVDHV